MFKSLRFSLVSFSGRDVRLLLRAGDRDADGCDRDMVVVATMATKSKARNVKHINVQEWGHFNYLTFWRLLLRRFFAFSGSRPRGKQQREGTPVEYPGFEGRGRSL